VCSRTTDREYARRSSLIVRELRASVRIPIRVRGGDTRRDSGDVRVVMLRVAR